MKRNKGHCLALFLSLILCSFYPISVYSLDYYNLRSTGTFTSDIAVSLQNGTVGESEISINRTRANVTVSAGTINSFVDNNVSDLDSNLDKGTHSNFSAQQNNPDYSFDNLTEENVMEPQTFEEYVDNNFSDVDSSEDKGLHSNFTAQQFGPDSIYDSLVEDAEEEENWFNDWQKRKKITINYTQVEADLNDFPILINITDTELRDYAQSDGDDIFFTASDGTTKLSHEIEKYTSTTGSLVAWVKAVTVSSVSNTNLYMYYGNPSAANQQNVTDVWSNGYAAVYHLNGGSFNDSTSNARHGTNYGSSDATGKIAGARDFQPADGVDYISIGNWNVSGSQLTIQAWINPDNFAQDDPRIISKATGSTAQEQEHVFMLSLIDGSNGENRLRFRLKTGISDTTGTTTLIGTPPNSDLSSAGSWHLAAATYDGSNMIMVRNGLNGGSVGKTGNLRQNSWSIVIGNHPGSTSMTSRSFDGKIDEVRISSVTRSASWLKTEYNNQYNSSSFYSIGIQEEKTDTGSGYLVQQGDFLFQGTEAYIPLEHKVNVTHALVLIPNLMWQENVTAATSGDPALYSDDAFVTLYLYNSTHICAQRWTSSDGDLRIGWQVIECFDREFTVQRGEKNLSSFTGQTTNDTISTPVDPVKSMAWHYWRTSYSGNDGRASQFYSNVTDGTTLTFTRQGTTSVTGYLRWVVAEWDTTKVDNFEQGYVTGYGTDTSPFIDAIGTSVNESQSILIFQTHAIGDDGLDTSTTAGYFRNDTHLEFYNYDSAFVRGVKWYIIDFGSGVGSRQDNDHVAWASSDYVNDDILDPVVQLHRSLVWVSGTCNGDGTAKPRHTQWWVLSATNSTHANFLHYERRYGGQNREIAWQILELPYSPPNYELDLEIQWTDLDYTKENEELCINTGILGDENVRVDVWNGTGWETIFFDLSQGWNNASIKDWLTSSTFTIRFSDAIKLGDIDSDTWQIDIALIQIWNEVDNYELDLEVQWTMVDYDEPNEELCIFFAEGKSLDATNGYMIIGDGTPDWGSITGTISFWVKMDTSVQGRFWGQEGNMETRWSGPNLVLDWGATASMTSSTSFPSDIWSFVAIVWDENNDNLFLYVGDETNPPTLDANSLNGTWTSTTPLPIENRFLNGLGGNEPVDGKGDDLRYWNVARTLTEIQSDYNVQLTGSEANLRSYFKLNNDFDDVGPNNNDGSGSGSFSFSTDTPFIVSDTEDLQVDVWDGITWQNVIPELNNGWNNVTVTSYLTFSNFTIRYKGIVETGDDTQDSWNIDAAILKSWTETYDHVLSVTSEKIYDQNISLNLYNSGNIERLSNCTIWFRDGTTSVQISIVDGVVTQGFGSGYVLSGSESRYIVVYAKEATSGESTISIRLEAVGPNSIIYSCLIQLTVN